MQLKANSSTAGALVSWSDRICLWWTHLNSLHVDKQVSCREAGLSDAEVDIARLVSPVLCLAPLEVCHCLHIFQGAILRYMSMLYCSIAQLYQPARLHSAPDSIFMLNVE